ncbi:MAG: hypothetical protein DRJ49_03240 [Thermoprotei archaeon]|nr:MAG: hypothetical protein DRN53_00270 [Thermoprotei archaeon]RLE89371.1 MAG: hypothetical protein DRJ49_03240 [Thermoprotei archaeon]
MVKTPFCQFDLRTGVLCYKCQKMIEEGKYSELDFEVARCLSELENKGYSLIKNMEFLKAYEKSGFLIILMANGSIDRGDLAKLEKEVKTKLRAIRPRYVKMIIKRRTERSIIEQIIQPARLLSLNIAWFPDGSSQYSIKVYPSVKRMYIPKGIVESILKEIFHREVIIEA